MFWKYTANSQENIHAEWWFKESLQLYWNQTSRECSFVNLLHKFATFLKEYLWRTASEPPSMAIKITPANLSIFFIKNAITTIPIYGFFLHLTGSNTIAVILLSQLTISNEVNDVVLVFLLVTWIYFTPFSSVFIADFEQVNVSWILQFLQNN